MAKNTTYSKPILSFEEWNEAMKHASPPTDDDVTISWDGRAINTKEKLLAFLDEVEKNRASGVTGEELRQLGGNWREKIDWDWDPVNDPRS